MSNQVGDRYICSDPNCGCEIEVKSACAAGQDDKSRRRDYREDATDEKAPVQSMGHSIGNAETPDNRGFRTEGLATSSASAPSWPTATSRPTSWTPS